MLTDGCRPPEPYGKSPYTIYLELIQARPGWQAEMDSYEIDYLIIGNGTFLDLELAGKDNFSGENNNDKWREIYRDKQAAIFQEV